MRQGRCTGSGVPRPGRGLHHQQALELARASAAAWDEAHALAGLGRCAIAAADLTTARPQLGRAAAIFRRIGAPEATAVTAEPRGPHYSGSSHPKAAHNVTDKAAAGTARAGPPPVHVAVPRCRRRWSGSRPRLHSSCGRDWPCHFTRLSNGHAGLIALSNLDVQLIARIRA